MIMESTKDILASDLEAMQAVTDYAHRFYQEQLWSTEEGQVALRYLKLKRGLQESTIRRLQLGYAPEKSVLAEKLLEEGFLEKYLLNDRYDDNQNGTGICCISSDGNLYDRFHGRIIIPFFSLNGNVVGFSGEFYTGDDKTEMYVNSPESPLMERRENLCGLYLAKTSIKRKDECVVIMGELDNVLALYKIRKENVVWANNEVPFTKEQIQSIHQFTDNITIAFEREGDDRYTLNALNACEMCYAEGMHVQIVSFPMKFDNFVGLILPREDEYIERRSMSFIRYKTKFLLEKCDLDTYKNMYSRAQIVLDVLSSIRLDPCESSQHLAIQCVVSDLFKIEESRLLEALAVLKNDSNSDSSPRFIDDTTKSKVIEILCGDQPPVLTQNTDTLSIEKFDERSDSAKGHSQHPFTPEEKYAKEEYFLKAYQKAWEHLDLGELPNLMSEDINTEDCSYGKDAPKVLLDRISYWFSQCRQGKMRPKRLVLMHEYRTNKPFLVDSDGNDCDRIYCVYSCECNDDGLICKFGVPVRTTEFHRLCFSSLEEEDFRHAQGLMIFSPQWHMRELMSKLSRRGEDAFEFATAITELDYLSFEQKYILLWFENDSFISDLGYTHFDLEDIAGDIDISMFDVRKEMSKAIRLLIDNNADSPAIVKRVSDYLLSEQHEGYSDIEWLIHYEYKLHNNKNVYAPEIEDGCLIDELIANRISPWNNYCNRFPSCIPQVAATKYILEIAKCCVEYIEHSNLDSENGMKFTFEDMLDSLLGREENNLPNHLPEKIIKLYYEDIEIPRFLVYDIAMKAIDILKSNGWSVEEQTYHQVPVALVHVNKIIVKR